VYIRDFTIHMADKYEVGRLAMAGFIPQSGSLLLDRDIGFVAIDSRHEPVAALIARPSMFYHTFVMRQPDWNTARRLIERAQGWMEGSPTAPKTSLFQVAPDNATMERLAKRLGAASDPGQLWRVDL
jgi:hypothetical protein